MIMSDPTYDAYIKFKEPLKIWDDSGLGIGIISYILFYKQILRIKKKIAH